MIHNSKSDGYRRYDKSKENTSAKNFNYTQPEKLKIDFFNCLKS
jgi:hypothetical protein